MADPKKSGIITLESTDDDETIALADAVQADTHAKVAVTAGKAWRKAYGTAAAQARIVAAELLEIRRQFKDRRGHVDYNGSSRPYIAFIGERVWSKVFGKDYGPTTEGYNSFGSAVRRAVGELREERSKLPKTDPNWFPTAAQSGSASSVKAAAATKTDLQVLRETVRDIGGGMTKTFGADALKSVQASYVSLSMAYDGLKRPAVKLAPKDVEAISEELEKLALLTAEVGLVLDIRKDHDGLMPEEPKVEEPKTEEPKTEEPKTEEPKVAPKTRRTRKTA